MKRSFVFIDGNNLYHRIKSVASHFCEKTGQEYGTIDFDFRGFCNSFKGDTNLQEIHYYVGQVKRLNNGNSNDVQKSEQMYAAQQRLAGYLQKEKIFIKYGKLLREPNPSGVYHEKGVDVQIAVEMIRFALQKKYDIAYLISSDSDLIPAVKEVRALGKEVVYIGVKRIPTPKELQTLQEQNKDPYAISYGLTKTSSDFKIIEKEQILPFLKPREKTF
ncbi:NYN domain-containing protein [Candidatus Wolfebacteria bacterium]|nr:NYN domain-containing protein [Candidatus Wolfebacteria bacterium]